MYKGFWPYYTYFGEFNYKGNIYTLAIVDSLAYMVYDEQGYIVKVLLAPDYSLQIGDGGTSYSVFKNNIIVYNSGDVRSIAILRLDSKLD